MELSQALILISLLVIIDANPLVDHANGNPMNLDSGLCPTLNVNDLYYSLDQVTNISGIPADMCIHWKTKKVYFTLISEKMSMMLQVLTPGVGVETIKLNKAGQSSAVDNINNIVYLATDYGVYRYMDDGRVSLYAVPNEDVMYMAVSGDSQTMYIATWPHNRVQILTDNGQRQQVFSQIPNGHGLTIDKDNNLYFIASKTTYILKKDAGIPIKIKGLPSDVLTSVFVTKSNGVYAMDESSTLYVIDVDSVRARSVGSFYISGVNAFAIDADDNVLIGVKNAIMHFKPRKENPCLITIDSKVQQTSEIEANSNHLESSTKKPGKSKKAKRTKRKHKKLKTTTSTTTTTTSTTTKSATGKHSSSTTETDDETDEDFN